VKPKGEREAKFGKDGGVEKLRDLREQNGGEWIAVSCSRKQKIWSVLSALD
jgi:hypothetical protein